MDIVLAVLTAVATHEGVVGHADLAVLGFLGASLVGVDSPKWSAILRAAPHDFYHLPGYAALTARQLEGEAAAVIVEDERGTLLLPLILRPIPGGRRDATSPYGYPGPVVAGTTDAGFTTDAMTQAARVLADERVVSLFVRFHPLLNPAPRSQIGRVTSHGETVVIDLLQDDAALWQETRNGHRSEIRKAIDAGHRVYEDRDLRHYDRFVELYRETMLRVGAAPFYLFDDAYFQDLRATLGARLHLIVVEIEGEVATAAIEVETDGIVQNHLMGTDDRFSRHAPSKLGIHYARSWARDRGNRWMHLGGGLGAGNDSLLAFKRGFSNGRAPFHTLRVVLDDDHYRDLVRTFNPDADPGALDEFFPAYRQL